MSERSEKERRILRMADELRKEVDTLEDLAGTGHGHMELTLEWSGDRWGEPDLALVWKKDRTWTTRYPIPRENTETETTERRLKMSIETLDEQDSHAKEMARVRMDELDRQERLLGERCMSLAPKTEDGDVDYNAAPDAETMARQGETRSSIRQIIARRDSIKNELASPSVPATS